MLIRLVDVRNREYSHQNSKIILCKASLKPQNYPHLKDLAICNISSDGNSLNALIISDLSSSCCCQPHVYESH